MFDQVFENMQKATESSMKLQQEMFQNWASAFPQAVPGISNPVAELEAWRKKWEATTTELVSRQKELVDENYEAGLKSLEEVFKTADAKSPQEYQKKVTELYSKSFENLRQLSETQVKECQAAVEKLTELMTPTT